MRPTIFTLSKHTQFIGGEVNESEPFFLLGSDLFEFEISTNSREWIWGIGLGVIDSKSINRGLRRVDRSQTPQLILEVTDVDTSHIKDAAVVKLTFSNRRGDRILGQFTLPLSVDGHVVVYFQYLKERSELFVRCIIAERVLSFPAIRVNIKEDRFHVFGQSLKESAHIDFLMKSWNSDDLSKGYFPIKLGAIQVRLGDMFDNEVIRQSNMILLPASTDGTTTGRIMNRAVEFDIPFVSEGEPGHLSIFKKILKDGVLHIGYAYSVQNDRSSPEIIQNLCNEIIRYVSQNKDIKIICMPLLGSGAGRMEPVYLLKMLNEKLEVNDLSVEVIISVQTVTVFLEIKSFFHGLYASLPPEREIQKSNEIIHLEMILHTELTSSNYRINKGGELVELNLSDVKSFQKEHLPELPNLRTLDLSGHYLDELSFLHLFPQLKILYLNNCVIRSFDGLKDLAQLESLNLSNTGFSDLRLLSELKNLNSLQLKDNNIRQLKYLDSFTKLQVLDLADNAIHDPREIAQLKKLKNLNLSRNALTNLNFLRPLKQISILDVSGNQIDDARVLLIIKSLGYLKINNNPVVANYELSLDEFDNHLVTVLNYLLRQEEKFKISLTLPIKVLLMGNHATGKSSLLNYIQSDGLAPHMDSTHIIKIEPYPRNYVGLPEAIFFDFGGQDYYHGIYRAFLSGGAMHILLWKRSQNINSQTIDSKNIRTQNFKLDYWLAQKKYLEQEKFDAQDPILIVQTHAESEKKQICSQLTNCDELYDEFYVSMKPNTQVFKGGQIQTDRNKFALLHLKESIIDLINQLKVERNEPQWYVDFVNYIINEGQNFGYKSTTIKELSQHYRRDEQEVLQFLMDDLDQLHKQGLILYYQQDIPDVVWLNPIGLVKYIHDEVLTGTLLSKSHFGEVRSIEMNKFDKNVVRLLLKQKVIYYHKPNDKYIIPNFLPLISDNPIDFNLMTFGLGKPLFVLKFEEFLPFGFINQAICSFGNLPDEKRFWRDQLLFTLEGEVKILIRIDFQLMEIKVFANFFDSRNNSGKQEYIRYIFYGLLAIYWDMELLSFGDFQQYSKGNLSIDEYDLSNPTHTAISQANNLFENSMCRPLDLYISLDDQHFIDYRKFCEAEDQVQINSRLIGEDRELTDSVKILPIYDFQPFTLRSLKRLSKAVISYSKKDIELVNKFKQYLVPLFDDGLMENPWYCTSLIAGSQWDEEIQRKFDEADIIFFLISENLLATQYVKEQEIKKAIDKWDKDKSIKIVPIILVPYPWTREGTYNLGRFTALPYTALPITSFKNQNEAWNYVSQAIRIMITQDLYPGTPQFEESNDMKEFFAKVMRIRSFTDNSTSLN